MRDDFPSLTTAALCGSLALFIISPLINVGPVNISAFLLLLASSLWLLQQPHKWCAYWRQHRHLLLVALLLVGTFWLSNLVNNNTAIVDATFAQSRWLLLLTVAAPAVTLGIEPSAWRHIFHFACAVTVALTAIYCLDTGLYLGFQSNFILDLVDAERGDPLRPSWVFNPHPFSRTLIAALLLLGGAVAISARRAVRMICMLSMLGLSCVLLVGAVRTGLLSLAAMATCVWILHAHKRVLWGVILGSVLGTLGLVLRTHIFPQQDPDQSLQTRGALFEQGILAFLDKPWIGGGYQAARDIPWPEHLQTFTATQTLATTNTHVQWLEMLVSYGLLGGALFVLLWSLWGWFIFDAQRRATGKFKLPALLLFLNWVSLTLAGFTTVYRESEWALWVVTILGTAWLVQHQGAPEESRRKTGDS